MLNEISLKRLGFPTCLPRRLQKGNPLQHERDRQYDIPDDKVGRGLGMAEFLNSMRD